MYDHYLESLSEEERSFESSFTFYAYLGETISKALDLAKDKAISAIEGGQLVSYSDYTKYHRIREYFQQAKERCDLLKDDTDLPYDEADEYIMTVLEECSLLLKIHLSKQIIVEEVSILIDRLSTCTPEAFNKLFLPEYDPHVRAEIVSFENRLKDRYQIFLAQILISSELGL